MPVTFHADAPDWFASAPSARRTHWAAGDGYHTLFGDVLRGYLVRAVLKSGEVLDGTLAGTRGAWTGILPSIAVEVANGRAWLLVSDIAEVWADRGPEVSELISRMVAKRRR